MKKATNIIIGVFSLFLIFTSCNDSFLDRTPTTDIDDKSFWQTVNDLKVYNNGIYNAAGDYNTNMFYLGNAAVFESSYLSTMALETQSDNFASKVSSHAIFVKIAAGQETVPSTETRGAWTWSFLRRCNIFLDNYHKAAISDNEKNEYFLGEVLFFRAWFYLDKVQKYGDVPLALKTVTIDSDILFAKQTDRKIVMDSVLLDIDKAIKYLPTSWPGNNSDRITKWTALALKSRICLYEGTFRKYHSLGDHEVYLKEAVKASKELIDSKKYEIYNTGSPYKDFRTVFTSEDLTGNPECIMVRVYAAPTHVHNLSRYIVTQAAGATKDFVDDFLCIETDGTVKPIALSKIFNDKTYEDALDNRDPRLTQTILDPRKVQDILHTNHIYPNLTGMSGSWESPTGYHLIKGYQYEDEIRGFNGCINDYPIIRYAEILLNYAEAKAELEQMTEEDLNMSINEIRKRVGMPNLTLNPEMDPKYAGEGISSLLVEIRRERRVELSFENFRYQDLMRWKKGSYLTKPVLGMRLEDSDRVAGARFAQAKVTTVVMDGKKYLNAYAGTVYDKRTFEENKHYYHPIPINVKAKNPNLVQNPGWDN